MSWQKTNFKGVYIFEPKIWSDSRGYFIESFNKRGMNEVDIDIDFVQDNESMSMKGVLRGLHFQKQPYAQSKLVRVICGEVLDVIVDLRPESSTYRKHMSVVLNDINKKQLLVPKGFAHGYIVLVDDTIFSYKCDEFYHRESESGIRYDDASLGIDWILPIDQIIVSDKDALLPYLDPIAE